MNGARDYCVIFKEAEQVGRLYLLPGSHARGLTFSVYVLPENEEAIENGGRNPPLNNNAVEVYGAVSGHRGWTESYVWIHEGPWMKDLAVLFLQRQEEWIAKCSDTKIQKQASIDNKESNKKKLLSTYKSQSDE